MSPINIPDIWTFSYALLTVAALVVVGYYITRKRSPFINRTSGQIKNNKKKFLIENTQVI